MMLILKRFINLNFWNINITQSFPHELLYLFTSLSFTETYDLTGVCPDINKSTGHNTKTSKNLLYIYL